MGALTLKPSAYSFRPWEVVLKRVPDLFDFSPTGLLFGVRGNRVVRINKADWLRDRVRFSYDGFRRQRLVKPYHNGKPVGIAEAFVLWWSYFTGAKQLLYFGPDANKGTSLLVLLLKRIGSFKGPNATSVYNLNRVGVCFYGPFGLGASAFGIALPVQIDYEELKLFTSPLGVSTLSNTVLSVFQALIPVSVSPVRGLSFSLGLILPQISSGFSSSNYRLSRSVLQVSPLQRLLMDAFD